MGAEAKMKRCRMGRLFRKFQAQLILWFVLILLIPSCMISILYFQGTTSGQLERQERLLNQQANEYASLFASRVQSVENGALSITSNSIFEEYLSYPYQKPATKIRDAVYSFQPMVRWLLNTNTQYSRIHFLTSGSYTSGDPFVDSLEEYAQEPWVQRTLEAGMDGCWQSVHEPQAFRYAASPAPRVASYSLEFMARHAGIVLLDIDMQWLYQGIPFVVDAQTGEVIYSCEHPEAEGTRLDVRAGENMRTAEIAGMEYFVCSQVNEELGVCLVACAETSFVHQAIADSRGYFLLWVTLCICATLALVLVFSRSVIHRMSLISDNISKITRGDYDVAFESRRNDEIDELGTDVVSMGRQMNQMVNQRLNQQMLLREAEFRALQQQINPHFIFNMLQTVQMMAEINGQPALADIISQFGRMVRYNLYAQMNVPLREELENVRNYLALQGIVMNDELEAQFDVDESAVDVEVPRLILQPLAENAVLHGKRRGQVLHVRVTARRAEHGLWVCIWNDGSPLGAEEAQSLQETLRQVVLHPGCVDGANAKDNLALINIQKRLNIRFGPECVLSVENAEGGVRAAFVIPKGGEDS